MTKTEKLKEISKNNQGILKTDTVIKNGISKVTFSKFVKKNGYIKVAKGIYTSPDFFEDPLFFLQLRCPKTIFSHETALYLLDMTVQEPHFPTVTVKSGYNASHLKKEGCKIYFIKENLFELGAIRKRTPFGNEVILYNLERTICDILRNRSTLDVQIFQEAMKNYVKRKDKNLYLLLDYAKQFKVEKLVKLYLEVLL